MKNQIIKLMTPEEVQEFVNIASRYDFDIDLKSGAHYLDGKSFLGLLTQGLERELVVLSRGNDITFSNMIQKFAVA